MIEAFLQGLGNVFSPIVMLCLVSGSIVGVIVGIIPVLGGLLICTVALPFIYGMPAAVGLSFLVAIYAANFTGGSMTAILLNIPGTAINAATLIDGYPMTQKGQAGRAIGAAILSSGMGGVLSVFLALAVIPVVLIVVMAFRSPEMFLLTLVGISLIATLGRGSMLKGLISGFLGIIISFIGFQAVTGAGRFTLGSTFLYDGIQLIPFILGIFALPELIELAISRTVIAQAPMPANLAKEIFEGFKDVFRHFWLFLRSSVLGYLVGAIPGIGGEVATFASYAQAKQFSRNPEKFGTGCVEGVIAPESANNASQAGAMLPTLSFGIPGGATTALFLGAFVLVGIVPGPGMLTRHLDLAFTLLMGIALGNIFAVILCFLLARWTTKIAYVHADYLFPLVLAIIFIGTYVSGRELLDLVVLLLSSVLGYAMKKFDYSRAALFLGFILGHLAEKYFFRSLSAFGPLFFFTPLSLVLIAIMVLLLSSDHLRRLFRHLPRRGVTNHEA